MRSTFVSDTYFTIMCGAPVADHCFCCFRFVCIVMWGLYVDHSSHVVGHMCYRHICLRHMPVM